MKRSDNGTIQCRVKITGTFRGKLYEYVDSEDHPGSQFIWSNGDPSTRWWTDGNMSCDCNRGRFIGIHDMECGETINIDTIEPVDYDGPMLTLNETRDGHA